ncbi:NAD(P)H-hydrate dehydratase [Terasakiella sp. SH-1]|uniref:NAD(P)H-hydrate dehydratase n=1 Tax=Terasakiella sp. SH-1 TaxID=2560057 RepID=UPI001F10CEE1|nr:NAD(P)H-hydrate dehydratase [Terasakiella sp. SH-1]
MVYVLICYLKAVVVKGKEAMGKNTKNRLLTVEEMYEADRLTIASGIPGVELMEAAGLSIVREITQRWSPKQTVILCGPGNNGGDGFVIARLLKERGIQVKVLLLGDQNSLKGDAKINADRWTEEIHPLAPEQLDGTDLIVDAIFGAGLVRNVEGIIAQTLEKAKALNVPIVAVDTPSGLHGESGQVLGTTLPADLTVTFCRPKTGHYLYPAKKLCGELVVTDIGIPDAVIEEIDPKCEINHPQEFFPWPDIEGHKYHRGHGVIVGGPQMTGATRLAAICARRVGAGLLTINAHGSAYMVYRQGEAGNIVSNASLDKLLSDPRKNAYLIGPGLGIGDRRKSMVHMLLQSKRHLILDADALSMLDDWQWQRRGGETLLTPHEGEFARLFPEISGSKVEKARIAARLSQCTVLLKGPDTVIASPDGRAVINTTGTPWLATAGSGDSLAGICLGLMCQGLGAFEAGCLGAWFHGRCAEEAGAGLIAEDIGDFLPLVIKTLQK